MRPIHEVKPPKPREPDSTRMPTPQAGSTSLPARVDSHDYPTPSSIFSADREGPEQVGAIMIESQGEDDLTESKAVEAQS